jgi:hypothetical protein
MRPVDARNEEKQQLNDTTGDVRDFGGFKGVDDTSASLLRR